MNKARAMSKPGGGLVTCAASRHAALMAEELLRGRGYPMLDEEPDTIAASVGYAVASLWETRAAYAAAKAEIAALKARIEELERQPSGNTEQLPAQRRGGVKTMKHVWPDACCDLGEFRCVVPMPLGGRLQGIDYCIADIVAALNAAGIETMASCCGHGRPDLPGNVRLADGREITITNHVRWWDDSHNQT